MNIKKFIRKKFRQLKRATKKLVKYVRYQAEMVQLVEIVEVLVFDLEEEEYRKEVLVVIRVDIKLEMYENSIKVHTIALPRIFLTIHKGVSEFREWVVVIKYSFLLVMLYITRINYFLTRLKKIDTKPERVQVKVLLFVVKVVTLWHNGWKSVTKVVEWILSGLSLLRNFLQIQDFKKLRAFYVLFSFRFTLLIFMSGFYLFLFLLYIPIMMTAIMQGPIFLAVHLILWMLLNLIICKLWTRTLEYFGYLDREVLMSAMITGMSVAYVLLSFGV